MKIINDLRFFSSLYGNRHKYPRRCLQLQIRMIKIDDNVIEQILKNCINELKECDSLSFKNIESVTSTIEIEKCGIVYFIYSNNKLKYIGKSKGKYFRQRVKAHFFGVGKGTKSKYDLIKNEKI